MSKTIEFGAFLNGADGGRLAQAQRVASGLGVTLSADGSRFAGTGAPGDPVKVTVNVPSGTVLTREAIVQGRNALDDLLSNGERLTDYALVKEDGVITEVVSLLTAESRSLPAPVRAQAAQSPVAQAPARRRWSPFTR